MKKGILPVVFFIFLGSSAHAIAAEREPVTPYGDSCPLCGDYGYCNKQPTHKKAVAALEEYYREKGLHVTVKKQDGRFLEAEVYKDKKMVDRILLDLKTGLIRSIN